MPQAPPISPEGKFQKGMSKTSQKGTFGMPGASFLPLPHGTPHTPWPKLPQPSKAGIIHHPAWHQSLSHAKQHRLTQ